MDHFEHGLLLRVEDVARLLGLSRSRVYALLAEGGLPVLRIGRSVRVPAEALREWIAENVDRTLDAVGKDS